jgi:hypothetical protein
MKKIFLFSFLFFVAFTGFSQRFINGAGICAFSNGGSGFSSFITGGITYSPRVNISESDNSAVSIGMPISLGVGYSSGSGDGNASASAVVNIPLVINYNFGCGSTRQNESRIGFFAGGGFGYHVAAYANDYDDETTKIESYGPVGNAGIRIGVGRGAHNIEIKASYMKGLDTSKADIFGLAGIFNF